MTLVDPLFSGAIIELSKGVRNPLMHWTKKADCVGESVTLNMAFYGCNSAKEMLELLKNQDFCKSSAWRKRLWYVMYLWWSNVTHLRFRLWTCPLNFVNVETLETHEELVICTSIILMICTTCDMNLWYEELVIWESWVLNKIKLSTQVLYNITCSDRYDSLKLTQFEDQSNKHRRAT